MHSTAGPESSAEPDGNGHYTSRMEAWLPREQREGDLGFSWQFGRWRERRWG